MAHLQKQARQFLKVGMDLIQQGTGVRLNPTMTSSMESSDDEEEEVLEDESFIIKATRGIIIFHTISNKTQKQRILHLYLFKQIIILYNLSEHNKKHYDINDIITIIRYTDSNVGIELKQTSLGYGLQKSIMKRLSFESESKAHQFHLYVEYMKESGKSIKDAWNMIDYKKTGFINEQDLIRALERVDLIISKDQVKAMLDMSDHESNGFDYYDFFHLFINSFVSNLRECLQEWLTQALITMKPSTSSQQRTRSISSDSPMKQQHEANFIDETFALHAVPGEVIAFAPRERIHWGVFTGKSSKHPHLVPGMMYATNYRVVLFSLRKTPVGQQERHSRYDVPSFFNKISIPLSTCQRIYHAAPRNSIYLVGKDFRTVRISLTSYENSKNKAETFLQVLHGIAYQTIRGVNVSTGTAIGRSDSGNALVAPEEASTGKVTVTSQEQNNGIGNRICELRNHLFAFKYHSSADDSAEKQLGWNQIDLIKEYVRQGLYDCPEWQIFENTDWNIIETYPRYLALPRNMSNHEIIQAAQFRSKMRLPVITYLHRSTGAVLTRSAQPLVGLTQKNSIEDERLLNLFRCKGRIYPPKSEGDIFSKLYIFDARGKVAATLNMAAGKGTEDVSLYQNTELIFCNIDNIHVMRTSATILSEVISNENNLTTVGILSDVQLLNESSSSNYFGKMHESCWLRHIRLILVTSVLIAEKLHFEGASVLIHCSDGWDRTAQTCCITQILLDPYFRTLEGIAALIEKDWCSFGYQFQYRCGHGWDHNYLPDERSPIFLQFIEVLYQLLLQFPNAFEYNEQLLIFLIDHLYSCLFGNFLGNCEKDRMIHLEVRESTRSIWSYVLDQQCNHHFINSSYKAFEFPLWPCTHMTKMRLWERYWMRWDYSGHPNRCSGNEWHDDWGVGIDTNHENSRRKVAKSFDEDLDDDANEDDDADDGLKQSEEVLSTFGDTKMRLGSSGARLSGAGDVLISTATTATAVGFDMETVDDVAADDSESVTL